MNPVRIAFIVLALFPQFAKASDGATFDMAIGRPVVSIQNPDGPKAYYDGISTNVSVGEPVLGGKSFAFRLVGSFRYSDLKNTNSTLVSETAQLIGPAAGIEAHWEFLSVGYEYGFMAGRHQVVGPISKSIQYNFSPAILKLGMHKRFKKFSVGLVYSKSDGVISSDQTGLSSNSPFSEATYWLNVRIDFGESIVELLKDF